MPTLHPDLILQAGDDWVITGTLTDQNGAPFASLSAATFDWVLLNSDGDVVLTQANANITTNGSTVSIAVAAAVTATLLPDRCIDVLRMHLQGLTDTMWDGVIGVDANPFSISP